MSNQENLIVNEADLSSMEKMENFIGGMICQFDAIAKKAFEYIKETKPEKLEFGTDSVYEDWNFYDDNNIAVYYREGNKFFFDKFIMPLEAVGEELYKNWVNENI